MVKETFKLRRSLSERRSIDGEKDVGNKGKRKNEVLWGECEGEI